MLYPLSYGGSGREETISPRRGVAAPGGAPAKGAEGSPGERKVILCPEREVAKGASRGSGDQMDEAGARYVAPKGVDRIFNRVVALLTRAGISLLGSRILRVRGRSSGQWRETPVNLLTVDGQRYLVAPRGTTQWVRNIRVAGGGELRVGRRVTAFTVQELPDGEKPPVIRAYLERWAWEVGRFFEGLNKSSPDSELLRVATDFPVFRVTTPPPASSDRATRSDLPTGASGSDGALSPSRAAAPARARAARRGSRRPRPLPAADPAPRWRRRGPRARSRPRHRAGTGCSARSR